MARLTRILALTPAFLCATATIASADDASPTAASVGKPTKQVAATAAVGGQAGISTGGDASASATATGTNDTAQAAPTGSGEWEEKWMPWNTGEEHADMGFAFFGHLGLGSRLNEGPTGEADAPNGLRIGITGIFRPIRYFGFGIGYEHADLERTRVDQQVGLAGQEFRDTTRELNNLWIDARAYPLRFDPFAMYINIAGAFAFQDLDSSSFVDEDLTTPEGGVTSKCEGSGSVGMGMKAGIGAELALVSGAILWAELGPDYYLLSEESLDGCDVGAGNAFLFGFRGGLALGFERTKVQKQVAPLPAAPKDSDGDKILDDVDACPSVAGVADPDPKKNGCPPDKDGDTILDAVDACPDQPGLADPDPKKNGCPPPKDRDADLVTDDVDACPDIPGIKTDDPKTNGCPGDSDEDGFRDDQDACPQEKGVDDPDPTKRGCPKLVRVTEKEIVILEQVQFDTGKATIKKESDALLDSVAQVLKEHPEILKLEVQGHTDNKGTKQLNTKLSDDRAKSVQKALEKRGVDASRLQAKGYGPDKPIADNGTDAGRAQNRRVQFIVLEKKARAVNPGNLPAPAPTPAPAPAPAPAPTP